MSDRAKNILKFLGVGVIWVYILSIRIGGETIFATANDILVQNQIVEAIDRQFADAADGVVNFASNTFDKLSGRSKNL